MPPHRLGIAASAFVGLVVSAAAAALASSGEEERPLRDAVTTLDLAEDVLAALGVGVVDLEATGAGAGHPLSVADAAAPRFAAVVPAGLRAVVRDGAFVGFAGGALRHRGGLVLEGRAGRLRLDGLELRPGRRRFSLAVVDDGGETLLETAQPQWELEPARLAYFNADLRIAPALARRLGSDALAGATVGVLALDAQLQPGPAAAAKATAVAAGAPPPCGDWSGEVDVAIVAVESVSTGGIQDGRVVVVPSVTLENVGTANVPWYSRLSGSFPPHDNDQHPFLVWQMLREQDGMLVPLGRSDVKHAFATGNDGCEPGACTDLHILGLGCADTYGISSNTSNGALAPREEVTASTGIWAHCDTPVPGTVSHFDTNGDCALDFTGGGETVFTHGLAVQESELDEAAARYFVEAFYVVRDDVDVFNSMSFVEVRPQKVQGIWVFPELDPSQPGPAIDAWVDPASPGPGEASAGVDTGVGHLELAARVSDLGGGVDRYAFALANHDFDRRVASFRVPAAAGATGLAFFDGDEEPANDWTPSPDGPDLVWTAPAGNELDWGTLFSFVLEIAGSPLPADATLAVAEAGDPSSLAMATLAPLGLFADDFESGDVTAWSSSAP